MSENSGTNLTQLIIRALDGDASEQEFRTLNDRLKADPDAIRYHRDLTELYLDLQELWEEPAVAGNGEAQLSDSLLNGFIRSALARAEREGQPIEPPPQPQPARRPPRSLRMPHWLATGFFYFKAASAAAMFGLVLIAILQYWLRPIPVGHLAETLHAEWNQPQPPISGDRVYADAQIWDLRNGFARLEFDSGAAVLIEGPALFRLHSTMQLELLAGKASLHTPAQATGFSIVTPAAEVTDLGTDIGISVLPDNSVGVHLLNGKAAVRSRGAQTSRTQRQLEAGQAVNVDRKTGQLTPVPIAPDQFARYIDARTGLVWRGQHLSLTDLLCQGNGFGAGRSFAAIDPLSGQLANAVTVKERATENRYRPVPQFDCVDGVFVPDASRGPVAVSSTGLYFEQCPDTWGWFTHEIAAFQGLVSRNQYDSKRLVCQGRPVGSAERPALLLHSNIGITFDLWAIQQTLPGLIIDSFKTDAFLSETEPGLAELFILVDAQPKAHYRIDPATPATGLDIPLLPRDRFLTLVVTDCRPENEQIKYWYSNDFLLLLAPALGLRAAE